MENIKRTCGIMTAVFLCVAMMLTAAASFSPRYVNILKHTGSAKQEGSEISIFARLSANDAYDLSIRAEIERDGEYVDSFKVQKANARFAKLNEQIPCQDNSVYTITFEYDAGGETEEVIKTVRT